MPGPFTGHSPKRGGLQSICRNTFVSLFKLPVAFLENRNQQLFIGWYKAGNEAKELYIAYFCIILNANATFLKSNSYTSR